MNILLTYFAIPILSFALVLIITKPLRKLAKKLNLVDKPNERKVHSSSVPLIGGISVLASAGLALIVSSEFWNSAMDYHVLIYGSSILFVIGVIDDKMEVRSILKLVIQIALAYFVYDSGIRIESMFGIFGIHELPVVGQYVLTIFVIVGVINAFNLMDGIDG